MFESVSVAHKCKSVSGLVLPKITALLGNCGARES